MGGAGCYLRGLSEEWWFCRNNQASRTASIMRCS
jgi:hypothetical protein